MALAVCRDLILVSTVICRPEIGLYQMSWSPFPCRRKIHPFWGGCFSHAFRIQPFMTILSCRSDLKIRERGETVSAFNSKSSGTAKRVRSSNASKEPDSRTRPGMSLLVAIHTPDSSSHVKLITYYIINTTFPIQGYPPY